MGFLERKLLADVLLAKEKKSLENAICRAKDWANNLTGDSKTKYMLLLCDICKHKDSFFLLDRY